MSSLLGADRNTHASDEWEVSEDVWRCLFTTVSGGKLQENQLCLVYKHWKQIKLQIWLDILRFSKPEAFDSGTHLPIQIREEILGRSFFVGHQILWHQFLQVDLELFLVLTKLKTVFVQTSWDDRTF